MSEAATPTAAAPPGSCGTEGSYSQGRVGERAAQMQKAWPESKLSVFTALWGEK